MKSRIRIYYWLVTAVAAIFTVSAARAGNDPAIIQALAGSQHQLQVDSFRMVEDTKFFDTSYRGRIDTPYSVKNMVTLMVDEASGVYIASSFTATVRLRIYYTTPSLALDSVDRNFTINYDTVHGHTYNLRSSFVFSGAHRVTVRVLTITSNVTWDVSSVLRVENELTPQPNYIFTCTNTVSFINVPGAGAVSPNIDELPVSWADVSGADQYDLEWAYIDSTALANNKYGTPPNASLIFANNATRVTVDSTSYRIPLIYDDAGTLFVRVRPVQTGANGSLLQAQWSSDAATPVLGSFVFGGHQPNMNWQSSVTYAEGGKRKAVVQYFDGSLRSRQTVTKDNTTDTTIIAETFYDYQGRPAVQVLPVPSLNNIIQYSQNFNIGLNGGEYDKSNYDSLTAPSAYASSGANPMLNTSGAAQYYSSNNPDVNIGYNQYIPDGQGYVFTETQYTQDNTGRISKQSGVGPTFRIGSNHETQYFYGSPDQNELDALFGTEVGDHSHYFKNMVRDANGQYSVSYVDMHGRTIASALAGAPDSNYTSILPSNYYYPLTENIADSNNLVIKDLVMENQKSLLVPVGTYYTFNYSLNPSVLQQAGCDTSKICYSCLYDLEITITDNANNQLLGGQPFDTVIHNFSLDSIQPNCTGRGFSLSFQKGLPPGEYEITKKLTVNRDALNYYRDSIFMRRNNCTTLQQFIDAQRALLPQCQPAGCAACQDSVGTWVHYRDNYLQNNGISPADSSLYIAEITTAYQAALAACSQVCGTTSEVDDVRNAMLLDMMPPYGQYANPAYPKDTYSVFLSDLSNTSALKKPLYQDSAITYTDASGKPDSVYDDHSQTMVVPQELDQQQFINKFRPSWANALLQFHPEYCKLLEYERHAASAVWDRQFESTDSYEAANVKGYLNPTNNSSAPFNRYQVNGAYTDPLSLENSTNQSNIENKMQSYLSYQGTTYSLWAVACMVTKCASGDQACINFYATAANDFDTAAMCGADLDMAWRNYREMYLNIKRDIVDGLVNAASCTESTYNPNLNSVPSSTTLTGNTPPHQPEFNTATNSLNQNGLRQFNNSTPSQVKANERDSANIYYTKNAQSYATLWAQQLSPCNYDAYTLNNVIIPQLVGLCQLAADSAHPFGASTLPPGVTYTSGGHTYTSLQDVVNQYNAAHGITDALHCNGDLITAPAPYNEQQAIGYEPIYTKPDSCECSTLNTLYKAYQQSGGRDSSFAAYLARTENTVMNESDLDQLLGRCNNTLSCQYLSTPINLPPALQCNTGDICVTCYQVASLYQAFQSKYPGITPAEPTGSDSVQYLKNQLFANYMNNQLGFGKQAGEYLSFMQQCGSWKTYSCDTLSQIKNSFLSYKGNTPHLDASGADTTHWKVDFGGWNYTATVPLARVRQNGVMQLPAAYADSLTAHNGDIDGVDFDYYNDSLCVDTSGFTFETRVQLNDTDVVSNGFGANWWMWLYTSPMTDPVNSPSYILIGTGPGGNALCNYDQNGGGPGCAVVTNQTPVSTNNWTVYKLVVRGRDLKWLINDSLYSENTLDHPVSFIGDWSVDPWSFKGKVDYIKIYDTAGHSLYDEEFTDSVHVAYPSSSAKCTPCQARFTTYFNNRENTSYTYTQIDSIYQANCGGSVNINCSDTASSGSGGSGNTGGGSGGDFEAVNEGSCTNTVNTSTASKPVFTFVARTDIEGGPSRWYQTEGGGASAICPEPSYATYASLGERYYVNPAGLSAGEIGAPYTNLYTDSTLTTKVTDSAGLYPPRLRIIRNITTGRQYVVQYETIGDGTVSVSYYDCSGGLSSVPADSVTSTPGTSYRIRLKAGHGFCSDTASANVPVYLYDSTSGTRTFYANVHVGAATGYTDICIPNSYSYTNILALDTLPSCTAACPGASAFYMQQKNHYANADSFLHCTVYDYDEYLVHAGGAVTRPVTVKVLETTTRRNNPANGGDPGPPSVDTATVSYTIPAGDSTVLIGRFTEADRTGAADLTQPCEEYHVAFLVSSDAPVCGNSTDTSHTGGSQPQYYGPLLCGKVTPVYPPAAPDTITACTDSTFFAVSAGTERYNSYTDSVRNGFEQAYINKCMQAYRYESFTVTHNQDEYHYTLYYYDQAGNLVKTIPPAGIAENTDVTWLSQVRAARASGNVLVPNHLLETDYRYNTLNQQVAVQTPDAGTSHFWYDRLGRLCLSQNAKQADSSQYSYTLYDSLGRITEVGQLTSTTAITDDVSRVEASLLAWIANVQTSKEQVTRTVYDEEYTPLEPVMSAKNLRNRVAWTALYNSYADLNSNTPAAATYYTYDIEGNVDTLVQDFKQGVMNDYGNRFKKVVYQYDLVSGKVNSVAYQPGAPDAFYHRYTYDAENRITNVETSSDSLYWENEAFYTYYRHGPLARTVLGHQQVQGVDYAYTLQGWLKMVNTTMMDPWVLNFYHVSSTDIGKDGIRGTPVAKDAYGYMLSYYGDVNVSSHGNREYSPIAPGVTPMAGFSMYYDGYYFRPLFNGNISAMSVNVPALGSPMLYTYKYDQLHRLTTMRAYIPGAQDFNYWPSFVNDFAENAAYDENGNITSYQRNGNNTFAGLPLAMDNLTYTYKPGTNQLDHITDAVPRTNYTEDIDTQNPNNYAYDKTGNMVQDKAGNIDSIGWTVYGKIQRIVKHDGHVISYTYDAAGNRISKTLVSDSCTDMTWYVRDAQGNILSTYSKKVDSINRGYLTQTEVNLYGSSRLGIYKPGIDVQHAAVNTDTTLADVGTAHTLTFTRGKKFFELTNHLGNVLATLTDRKQQVRSSADTTHVDHYEPDVATATDYYPFGMPMPGRPLGDTTGKQVKQVQVCTSCARLQELVTGYFNSLSNSAGDSTSMLNYVQNGLAADSTVYTTAQVQTALNSCGNGWKKNVAVTGGNQLTGTGNSQLSFHTEDFSLEGWVYLTTETHTPQTLFNSTSYLYGSMSGYLLYVQDGYLYFKVGDGIAQLYAGHDGLPADSACAQLMTVSKLPLGQWLHIVAVRTGNYATGFKLYVNGAQPPTQVAQYDHMSIGDINYGGSSGVVIIGNGSGSGGDVNYLQGLTKNVRVYHRAVTATEALNNYQACNGLPSDTGNLVLWLKFDEGSGGTATNYGSSGGAVAVASWQWGGGKGPAISSNCVVQNDQVLCTTVNQLTAGGGRHTNTDTTANNNGSNGGSTVPNTIHIEAENYAAVNGGLRPESTSDIGGGQDIGYVGRGDYLDYTVNVPAGGTYTVNFRVADGGNVGAIQLRKTDGTVLSGVTVPQTGGWQNWVTVGGTSFLLQPGTQTLRVYCAAVNWNLNWIELVPVNANNPPGNTAIQLGNGYDGGSIINGVSNTFTVEEWVNPTVPQTLVPVGSSGDGYSGANFTMFPANNGSHAGLGIAVGTNGISVFEHSDAGFPAVITWTGAVSGWTHIAVVYNNLTPSLYVNGQLVATGSTSSNTSVSPTDMIFGGYYGNMQGMVDEIRVWNYARSQQQVQAYMHQYVNAQSDGLAAYWQINASDGSTVKDISGNGHDKAVPAGYSTTSPGATYTSNAPAVSGGANYVSDAYDYGFNGKLKDNSIEGSSGVDYDYGARIYDVRLGRWLATDKIGKNDMTPYQFGANNPVCFIDPDGNDEIHFYFVTLHYLYPDGTNARIIYPKLGGVTVIQKPGNDKFVYHNTQVYVQKGMNVVYGNSSQKEFFPFSRGESKIMFAPSDNQIDSRFLSDIESLNEIVLACPAVGQYLQMHDPEKYKDVFEANESYYLTTRTLPKLELYGEALMTIALMADGYLEANLTADRPTVFNLSPAEYGRILEEQGGGNLPPGFKTIDRFTEAGDAISIKSMDVRLYEPSKLYSRLKGYLDKLADFNGASRTFRKGPLKGLRVTVRPEDIRRKILEFRIQRGALTKAKRGAIRNAAKYAKSLGLTLKVVKVR